MAGAGVRGVLAAALMVGAAGLSSCSRGPADSIDYAVDGMLTTYNTNTVAGAASGGPQAFARVLTGFNYHGPDGQIVGDHDFGKISVVGRAPLVLDYEINDNAVYSDGKPVTCDDMVLAWASQSGRFPGFDAASRAGYSDIASVDCAPGQKKARVSFAQDRGVRRLRPVVRRHVDDAVARDRRRTGPPDGGVTTAITNNDGADSRPHRPGVEHHLEPDAGPRHQEVPVVGALQAGLGHRGRRRRARRQRQMVGSRARHLQDHRVAAGRRHPGSHQPGRLRRRRRRGRLVGHAEPARRLRPHRRPVGGHRAAHLRLAGADVAGRRRAAHWRTARRAT